MLEKIKNSRIAGASKQLSLHAATKAVILIDKCISSFNSKSEQDTLLENTKSTRIIGIVTLVIFFGIFGVWSAFAPLDGASIAIGEVIVESNKKIVQHLEGGIIKEIMVKEGDEVSEGQALIKLNDVSHKSQLGILEEKQLSLMATQLRLAAIRDGKTSMKHPESNGLLYISKEKKEDIIHDNHSLFASYTVAYQHQLQIMDKRVVQMENELDALESQLLSAEENLELAEDDLNRKKELFAKNLIDKSRITSLERERSSLNGRINELKALIAKSQQKISEAQLEKIQFINRMQTDVIKELKDVSQAIHENTERLLSAYDLVERTIIRAPQKGRVTGMRELSIGGVVTSATSLMEVIPETENLMIEAKVTPNSIEAIASSRLYTKNNVSVDGLVGIKTQIRLTAFNSKRLGLLEGIMTYISADVVSDPRTGMHYYIAHIKVPAKELDRIKSKIKLYPGMPAVVFITNESRSLLSYLFSPITSTFETAFRER